jgi:glyoxylase-like metal-dependent hydrolase (beta-lactamase superfamily II)
MAEKLILKMLEVGPWPMNTYVLICPETQESVLFDPGAEPDTLKAALEGSNPIAILLTHTHYDHVNELDEMRRHLQVPVMAHPGPHVGGMSLDKDRELNTGDTVKVGNHLLRVFHAPGHVQDQICFVIEGDNRIIVGDTIFEGGPGRTWSAEDFKTTLNTLRNVVLTWADDSILYPGHGPYFRLDDKRADIEAFVEKDHGDFHGDATWEM